jgi:XRE family transcriptional regulator, fatty acid utilization regulator
MNVERDRKILAGGRLRQLRNDLALSQSAMATELGISISYLNLLERNLRPVTAQLLIRLSETYAIDPASFADRQEQKSSKDLEVLLADPVFNGLQVSRQDIKTLVAQAPGAVEMIKRLYAAFFELREARTTPNATSERGEGVASQSAVEEVRAFLQDANNHFPSLEEKAASLLDELAVTMPDLGVALKQRLQNKHGIKLQVMPVDVMGKNVRRLDMHRKRLLVSELVDAPGRLFQVAYQLGLLEASDALTKLIQPIANPLAQKLARISLANYFAAAVLMPYDAFLKAAESLNYDVEVLCARFQASFEQVAHRLTTLARPNARGIPFFMIRVDAAGNVSKRFSSGTFPFSRFGGTCPRWNIHHGFTTPGQVRTQVIELPEGDKWFSIARTVRHFPAPWGEDTAQFVVGLGCELRHAPRLVYAKGLDVKSATATGIGINCRLCERPNCLQRAAPAVALPVDANENVRGYSPFDSSLRG